MDVLLWILVLVMVVVGLAGTLLPVLPGVPLMFGGLWLAAWLSDYERVGVAAVIVLGLATLLTLLVDALASVFGAQRVGASALALWGALIGGVVGIFFGLPGLLLGPFIGAVLGEVLARGGWSRAMDVGVATWIGLLVGTLFKIVVAVMMLAGFAVAWWL